LDADGVGSGSVDGSSPGAVGVVGAADDGGGTEGAGAPVSDEPEPQPTAIVRTTARAATQLSDFRAMPTP
jgi:hypothetical protein